MRLKSIIHATLAVAAAGALPGVWQGVALAQATQSDATFTVGDIRIEGLQRISEGTVYNYLPVNIGFMLGPAIGSVVTQQSLFAIFPAAAVLTAIGIGALVFAARQTRVAVAPSA